MIKKLLAAVLIWGCVFSNEASAQWQTIFKDSLNYQCTSVYFINNDTGFVGAGWYPGTILRTLDGGQTWDTSLTIFAIFSIHFINDSVGFAGGQDGGIFKTTDMGENWNYVLGSSTLMDVFSVYFMSTDTGYASPYYGDIIQTIDGGANWQTIFVSSGQSNFPGTSRMIFTDSQTGFLAQCYMGYMSGSSNGTISKTIDRGLSWTDLNIPSNFYPASVCFLNSTKGIAVGHRGKVSVTYDAGLTWNAPDSIGPYPLLDIHFVTNSIGYIAGGHNIYTANYQNGIIYKTIDGGSSWQVMDSSYFDGLLKMYFPSDSVGYAAGMNGIILKITNANSISSSVQIVSPYKNQLTISPNPATDKIYISFPATASENITIKIYSITGEVVFEEENKIKKFQISPDTYRDQTTIDVTGLSNGIYFLSVQPEKEMVTKKVVVKH